MEELIEINIVVEFKGITYGFIEKDLYRLPYKTDKREYPLKKLSKVDLGRKKGYRLSQKPFTLEKIEAYSTVLQKPIIVKRIKHKSTPF